MKKSIILSVLFLAALLVGCGDGGAPVVVKDTPETISMEIVGNMKAMSEIFNTITDEASAKAAVPKIEAVRKNMRGVAARAKALPKMSDAEVKAFDAKMTTEMEGVMKTLMPARMKLQEVMDKNPEVLKILEPALTGMDQDM